MASTSADPDNGAPPATSNLDDLQPNFSFITVELEAGIARGDVQSTTGTVSVVGSIAHTITSTIVDGIVHVVAHWKVLLLGQSISLVLAAAGATNGFLSAECGVSSPSTYNAFGYFLLAIYGAILFKRDSRKRLKEENIEEQLRFHVEVGENDTSNRGETDEHDDGDDDLTLEDESPPFRSFSSLRNISRKDKNNTAPRVFSTPDDESRGSNSKLRPHFPFLCGLVTIRAKWYYYFTVAFIEVQAYYFIFLAFRYTTFTFVYISNAMAIPSAMFFTRMIIKKRYSITHLLGAVICIGGIVVNTVSNIKDTDPSDTVSSVDHVKGDLFALLGAVLMGLDDVLSEIIVTEYGGVAEMLFMKGFFATIISVLQLIVLEIDRSRELFTNDPSSTCDLTWRMILLSVHVVSRTLDAAGEMHFLYLSEAALLNLCLLTSDLYAAIFDVFIVGLQLNPYYYLALFLIFFGIVLYDSGPSPSKQQMSTPLSIEFCHRGDRRTGSIFSTSTTEHAGNLTGERHLETELT